MPRSDEILRGVPGTSLRGLYGRPFVPLDALLSEVLAPEPLEATLRAVHEEVCLGLAQVPIECTGGSHRSMGIMPPSRVSESGVDYHDVLQALEPSRWATFVSL